MIENCKFCEEKVIISDMYTFRDDWYCDKCKIYSFIFLPNLIVESETLRSGNFYLVYFPQYKTASIVSTENGNKKVISSFDMNELTHEQSIQWVNKLKTYSIFQ